MVQISGVCELLMVLVSRDVLPKVRAEWITILDVWVLIMKMSSREVEDGKLGSLLDGGVMSSNAVMVEKDMSGCEGMSCTGGGGVSVEL